MTRTIRLYSTWLAVLLVLLSALTPASAHRGMIGSPVDLALPANTAITTFASETTTTPIFVGDSDYFGIDWDVLPASGNPSVNVVILQSNNVNGPFTQWGSPLDGTSITNDVTITTTRGGSPLKMAPSGWIKYRINNTASVTVNVTIRGHHR